MKGIDDLYKKYGSSKEFLENSVKIYENGIVYKWPEEFTKIPFKDNYLLCGLSYVDNLFYKLGLFPSENIFTIFESTNYKRALRRGFGICSQNAIGLADLLYRRYNIDTYMVTLDGHVVLQANLSEKEKYILDPSVGILIPYSFKQVEKKLKEIKNLYAKILYPQLAIPFNKEGNILSKVKGGAGNKNILPIIEVALDILKWIIPILLILIACFLKNKSIIKRSE